MLPVELLLQIFEQLHDDRPTLLNLLLVSHHFSQLSESILYADVTLKPARLSSYSGSRRTILACFAESLSGPPSSESLRPHRTRRRSAVKRLFIDGSDIPCIPHTEYAQLDLILTKLPHLQSFHFTHLGSAVRWSPFASSRITVAPPFQLTRLIFNGAMHPSHASKMVHGFLASQTKLEHLEIGSVIEEALGSTDSDSDGAVAAVHPTLVASSSLRILETSALDFFLDAGKTPNLTHLKLSSSTALRLDTLTLIDSPPPGPLSNLRVLSTSRTPHLSSTASAGSPSAMATTPLPNLEYWELRSEWVDLGAFLQDPCVRRFLVSLPRLRGIRFSADVAVHSREGVAQTFESVLGLEFIEVRVRRKGGLFERYYRGEEKPRLVQRRCEEEIEWCQTWEHDASAS
ncbi:hypothetical protein PC9H_009251 [Pleurotus ostreatus]|uniref:F-box domain-containing protein n=1 Tax=Pleurotus ostreatus TaxID=5322 RepID=A0A8H6ZLH4_PLEOS|nr:uncharacterized protein PC9H_009251 [Pleurotus ostreatus]KAF7423953.1 hypothetical protein PC9H_009251 [Pleurotus ostreatus]KAJ8693249.1 hypothetical protein PTI98_010488 [Pleurotus ostreatus]